MNRREQCILTGVKRESFNADLTEYSLKPSSSTGLPNVPRQPLSAEVPLIDTRVLMGRESENYY